MLASGPLTVKFPTWNKPLVTSIFECNKTLQQFRARCEGPEICFCSHTNCSHELFLFPQTFWHISIHILIIIIASLNSILLLLVSISVGATLLVSSQRHLEYILDLSRTTAFSHLVCNKPVARFYALKGKIHTFKEQVPYFYCCEMFRNVNYIPVKFAPA